MIDCFLTVDWREEGYEGEIENFVSSQIGRTISWTATTKFRAKTINTEKDDGKFILKLFKVIDKDLKEINKKLLFIELGTDAYNFIVTDEVIFKEVTKVEQKDFHGSEKFRP